MKVQLNAQILKLDGTPLMIPTTISASLTDGQKIFIPGGTIVKTMDGRDVVVNDKSDPMTLAYIFENSLLSDLESDKSEPAKNKIERWNLAKKIHGKRNESIELDTSTIAMLTERSASCFPSSIVCGNVDEIIEGKRK